MRRLLVIYNPYSSRHADIQKEVLSPARKLSGYMIGKYGVAKVGIEKNIERFSQLLKDGDIVVSAGGDATAAMAVNAIIRSQKDVSLAVLPYGNFNDLARTLGLRRFSDIFAKNTKVQKLYPLEVQINNRHWRYASCYTTIGMMAEAVKIYDKPSARKKLKFSLGRYISSYFLIAWWYFRNLHKKHYIPKFALNSAGQDQKTSDYMAINGKSLARVMRSSGDFAQRQAFHSTTKKLKNPFRLFWFMCKSMFSQVPAEPTKGDILEFVKPSMVELQAEGESQIFENVKKIEIKKTDRYLKVITLDS